MNTVTPIDLCHEKYASFCGDSGKSTGGSCKDGDKIKIVEEKGVVMIVPE